MSARAGAHPMAKRGSQSFEVRETFVRARSEVNNDIIPITATKGDDGGHTLSASSASDLALAAAPLIELRERESNPRPGIEPATFRLTARWLNHWTNHPDIAIEYFNVPCNYVGHHLTCCRVYRVRNVRRRGEAR